jgi:nucleotide-binding universal stress UspA family protein
MIENGRLIATIDQEEERIRAQVEPYLAKWKSRFEAGGIITSVAVRFGHVEEQVADYAKQNDIDLIVVATRERRGLDRLLRRDVAQKIVNSVSAPVLLMKAA